MSDCGTETYISRDRACFCMHGIEKKAQGSPRDDLGVMWTRLHPSRRRSHHTLIRCDNCPIGEGSHFAASACPNQLIAHRTPWDVYPRRIRRFESPASRTLFPIAGTQRSNPDDFARETDQRIGSTGFTYHQDYKILDLGCSTSPYRKSNAQVPYPTSNGCPPTSTPEHSLDGTTVTGGRLASERARSRIVPSTGALACGLQTYAALLRQSCMRTPEDSRHT